MEKYLFSALSHADQLPIGVSIELDMLLISTSNSRHDWDAAKWGEWRTREMQLLFSGWSRLNKEIDPSFNKDNDPGIADVPLLPKGVESPARGMLPEEMKDPKLRAQYEASLKQYQEASKRYYVQVTLISWRKDFQVSFENEVVRAYKENPSDPDQLRDYIKKYVADKEFGMRLSRMAK